MNILFVGDVVGRAGVDIFVRKLPQLKRENAIDFVVVNCENASATNGVVPREASALLDGGADVLTGGNHSFGKITMHPYLDENPRILRPANYEDRCPGRGMASFDCGRARVTVINLQGQSFMDPLRNPFYMLDTLVEQAGGGIVLVDFHAEATSEKRAFGFYADGRVTAVLGTHTHVQTADEQILPGGTGYITDAGMTGVVDSVIRADKEIAVERFLTNLRIPFSLAEGECALCGVILDADERTGRCRSIRRIRA